jgi:hypothetical protein
MLGSFNHDFLGLKPRKREPVPVTVDDWCTNDGYGSGTNIEVLLQMWPGALVCCCPSTSLIVTLGLKAIRLKVTITGDVQALD